jgi:hypothetical protein
MWRVAGILLGVVFILLGIFGNTGKLELLFVGGCAIFTCLFRWNSQ